MIRKSGHRFSEKIMLNKKIERDGDSTKSHLALGSAPVRPGIDPGQTQGSPAQRHQSFGFGPP
jgi:hypothetical protein